MNQRQPTRIRRVVHLGNMGELTQTINTSNPKIKTERYATRFKKTHFIGIDIAHEGFRKKNWTQIKGDFLEGLNKLKDNSADLISSELSLGHYDCKGTEFTNLSKTHTLQTLQTVYKKLRPTGKLMVVVTINALPNFLETIAKTPFCKKIQVRPVTPTQKKRTVWMNAHNAELLQIIIEK